MSVTKDKFFNPAKVSARDKAATTDHTARAIIETEAVAREKKTEKLRALRLEQTLVAVVEIPAKKTSGGRAKSASK
jgi:vacuolar-type H+-ATPase subunit F/Vma7